MRVLVLHNFYRSANASGENLSVLDEIAGLRRIGWDVELLSSNSDVIASGQVPLRELAVRSVYSRASVQRVEEALHRFRPHVALVENLFPLQSPWLIRTLHSAGVPTAASVRSYRNWCAASNHFRDDAQCDECLASRWNLPAIRHGCYQGSRAASAPMALSLAVHRRTWPLVDRFLPVSEYVRDYLIERGIAPDRIVVRPNFVVDPGEVPEPGSGFMFAGRLSEEKGVRLLVEAWRRSEAWRATTLTVAGSGPMETELRALDPNLRVTVTGLVPNDVAMNILAASAAVIIPSMWHEPFGRGVIEAGALGRPAVVTNRGALPSTVIDGLTGWVAEPNPASLADALRAAVDPGEQRRRGNEARRRYEDTYAEAISLGILDRTLRELAGLT